jgi:AcrR family transcriptional regulator
VTDATPKRRGRPPSGGREAILAAALALLRERGIARMTTREVASLAGVSEASVFYHYGDRAGLLQAVFEEGLRPLRPLAVDGGLQAPDVPTALAEFGTALERFLDQALPVLAAAQSDTDLFDALGAYMTAEDLGPHRGVQTLAGLIEREQRAGRVRGDVDPSAVALMFVGACLLRVLQEQTPVHKSTLPPLEDVIATLGAMLRA